MERKCVCELFEGEVEGNPDVVAFVYGNRNVTYRELDERSNQLARYLRFNGINVDDIVAICVDRSPEAIIAMIGVLKSGGAYLPLDPTSPEERLRYIIEDSKAKLVITEKIFEDSIDFSRASLKTIISPKNLAYVIYTSGSTGKPKGVQISQESVVQYIEWCKGYYPDTRGLPVLLHGSLMFDMSVTCIYLPLSRGRTIIISTDRLELFEDLSTLKLTPSHLRMLSEENKSGRINFVESLIIGGESLPIGIVKSIPNFVNAAHIYNEYGPTEATVACSCAEISEGLVSIGKPISNARLYILDENLHPITGRTEGEIYIEGGLARGYLNRPDLTAERFIANPFVDGGRLYRTGDIGRYLPSGDVEYLGRIDDQIKIRGYRVEPTEIEATINCANGIKSSVVLAKDDEDGVKKIIAYIVPRENEDFIDLIEKVRIQISKVLPEYMVPGYFVELDEIPLTSNGKTDAKKLLMLDIGKRLLAEEYVAPRDEVEVEVCNIWQSVLNLNEVGVKDNFFKIGGNSLNAIRMVNKVNGRFLSNVKVIDVFKENTVEKISKIVKDTLHCFKYTDYLIKETNRDILYVPFELTNVQQAYYLGRESSFELGNISTHLYEEYQFGELDVCRLEAAINKLLSRHHALRTVFKDGQQRFLRNVPLYRIKVNDLKNEEELQEIRDEFSHKKYNLEVYPLFDIFVSKINERYVLHFSLDVLLMDGNSLEIFFRELTLLYQNPNAELPKLTINYKDYMEQYVKIRKSNLFEEARNYWNDKVGSYEFELALPLRKNVYDVKEPRFTRLSRTISKDKWDIIRKKSELIEISTTSVVLMVYGEVLRYWSNQGRVSINLTLFNRLPLHNQIDEIIGDFTVLELFNYKKEGGVISENLTKIHEQLWQDLENNLFDGIDFQRRIKEGGISSSSGVLMPVVLTSTLGEIRKRKFLNDSFEGVKYSISQTSQVFLDNKAYETEEGFVAEWDYVEELFNRDVIKAMHDMYCSLIDKLAEIDWEKNRLPVFKLSEGDLSVINEINSDKQVIDNLSIIEIFDQSVKDNADRIAIVDEKGSYSYEKLSRDVSNVAQRIFNGQTSGKLIGVWVEKGYEQAVAVLSVMKSSNAYLPFNLDWPEGRIIEILESSGADTLVVSANQAKGVSSDFKKKNIIF